MEEILLFKFFPIVDMCFSCEDIARQSCTIDGAQMAIFASFLRPVFPASRVHVRV